MRFSIEGVTYQLPNSLDDITLGDRLKYDQTHGKALRETVGRLAKIEDPVLKDLELTVHIVDQACRSVSFWGNIPLEIVRQTSIDDVIAVYNVACMQLSQETNFADEEATLQHEFTWKGETWMIQPIEIKHGSEMKFGELVDSKQVVQDLYELGDNKWESMVPLCAIFFRKKGEAYNKNFPDPEGERYQMMMDLPLSYALHVGFFLTGIINSFKRTFLSSGPAKRSQVAKA